MLRTWTASKSDLLISPFETKLCYPLNSSLRENLPNTEFFLVLFFLYSVRVQKNTDQKKLRIRTLFTQWFSQMVIVSQCFKKFWYLLYICFGVFRKRSISFN